MRQMFDFDYAGEENDPFAKDRVIYGIIMTTVALIVFTAFFFA